MTRLTTTDARAPRILERDIQNACTGYLELDGWRALRTDPVSDRRRGKGFGELGMADHLYVRYCYSAENCTAGTGSPSSWEVKARTLHSEVMWIEWKRPKNRASQHQKDWHAAERSRGALTLIAGEDFPASVAGFIRWYEQSGLNRRMRISDKTA